MDISSTTLAVIVALTAAIISLAGVIVTSVFNLLNTRAARQSEERKSRRDLILKTAVESYKQYCQNAKDANQSILPFDNFVLFMVYLSENTLDETIDFSNVERHLADIAKLKSKMIEHQIKLDESRKQ